ncbi:MAG: hypothetical protein M3067_06390 [Chloroflexota bacterium]|nr:hypothetical protein [Chloroflexota bacterium]
MATDSLRDHVLGEPLDARKPITTFGFQPDARLDEGEMWPTEFAVIDLTPAAEARIVALVKKAAR